MTLRPEGLRHPFTIQSLQAQVVLPLLAFWLFTDSYWEVLNYVFNTESL
jgi:hypothetical protein